VTRGRWRGLAERRYEEQAGDAIDDLWWCLIAMTAIGMVVGFVAGYMVGAAW
jgi:hypothetical protein